MAPPVLRSRIGGHAVVPEARWLVLLLALAVALLVGCNGDDTADEASEPDTDTVTVVDHWDREVEIPRPVERAVVMEWEGLVAKSMQLFGISERIVGVDDYAARQSFRRFLVPAVDEAVDVGSAWSGINYEQLATLEPDVVFLESWEDTEENREMHSVEVERLEDLGIPVVVFVSPSNFPEPDLATAWQHVTIVGEVFGFEDEAAEVVAAIEERIALVRERTADIPDEERAGVVLFATIDSAMGTQSIQSHMLTDIVNAENLVTQGTFVPISEEQLLALDPDVLVLLGHDGYLAVDRVLAGENAGLNWANLQQLRAIREQRLASLGYDEWRATIETPIGILKMAAAVYPERFEDLDVAEEELRFYEEVYGMDRDSAVEAVQAQLYLGEM